jgi:hypothetical protein
MQLDVNSEAFMQVNVLRCQAYRLQSSIGHYGFPARTLVYMMGTLWLMIIVVRIKNMLSISCSNANQIWHRESM